jgi:hypothetical protein
MSVISGSVGSTARRIAAGTVGTNDNISISVPFRSAVLTAGSHTPQIRVTSQADNLGVTLSASYTAVVAN